MILGIHDRSSAYSSSARFGADAENQKEQSSSKKWKHIHVCCLSYRSSEDMGLHNFIYKKMTTFMIQHCDILSRMGGLALD